MAGTVMKYGRPVSGPEIDYGYFGNGYQRACVYNGSFPQMIVYRLGIWAGVRSGSPRMRLGIGYVAGSGAGWPGDLIAQTGEIVVSGTYTDITGGRAHYGDIAPFVWNGSDRLALAAAANGGLVGHSMRAAASISATNRYFYDKDRGTANTITNPIEGTSEYNGHVSMWLEAEANRPPNKAGTPTVHTGGGDLTPLIESTFSDPNETLNNGAAWDQLTQYQILVKQGSTTKWNATFSASSSEKSARKVSRSYAGSALLYNTTYTVQVRHADRLGAWGAWSNARSFSIAPVNRAPTVPTSLVPVGNLTTAYGSSPKPTFYATFNDPDITLSTGQSWDYMSQYHIQVQRVSDGAMMWDAAYSASSTERNGRRMARAYAGSALRFNTAYRWRVRMRDRSNVWGPYSSWVNLSIYPTNSAPNRPGNLEPVGDSAGSDLTPLMTSTFSDPQETLGDGTKWDYLASYQIRVVQVSNGVERWNATFTATTSERNNRRSSRTYSGPALSYNTLYRYEIRHRDRAGAWSPWATSTFEITSLSSMDRPSSPSGYRIDPANPGDIVTVYRSGGGLAMTAYQAQLLSENGSVLVSGPGKTKAASHGATVTIPWAEAGLGSLQRGQRYQVRLKARDSNNVWSPNWGPARAFWINAAPGIPTNLTPTASAASPSRPKLRMRMTDPDPENPTSSLQAWAEILDASNNVLQTRSMTYNASTQEFEYQTTADDLPDYDTYKWRSYGFDGHVYTGGATTAAAASRSPVATFQYAPVPEVTVTGPGHEVQTIQPVIAWTTTASPQTHYQVRMYRLGTSELVYDSGLLVGAETTYTLDGGGWQGGFQWLNEMALDVVVSSRDATTLTGDSSRYQVTLLYDVPAGLGLTGSAVALPGTIGTSAIALSHTATSYMPDEFEGVVWIREELTGPDGSALEDTRIRLKTERNPAMTTLLDADVVSRQWYRYTVYQLVRLGNDLLTGEVSAWEGYCEFDGVVLHPVSNPDLAVGLHWSREGRAFSTELSLSQIVTRAQPLGRLSGSVAFFGPGHDHERSGDFGLIDDETGTAQEKLDRLMRLYHLQNGDIDGRPHILCWRSGRGGSHGSLYGYLDRPDVTDVELNEYEVSMGFREVAYRYGERDE